MWWVLRWQRASKVEHPVHKNPTKVLVLCVSAVLHTVSPSSAREDGGSSRALDCQMAKSSAGKRWLDAGTPQRPSADEQGRVSRGRSLPSSPVSAIAPCGLSYVAPTPWKPFEQWAVPRPDGTIIDVYIARARNTVGTCPTVVFFHGSKCLPVIMLGEKRLVTPLGPFLDCLTKESTRVNVVLVEKRGLKAFGPPPASRDELHKMMNDAFVNGKLYLKQTRVNDGVAVVKALLLNNALREVHLVGHSEGGDVATGVASALKGQGIKSVGLLAAAAPTRFFESGQIARQENGVEGIKQVFEREITLSKTAGSADTPEALQAVTYGLHGSPLDDVRRLKIPLFMAHGDADEKVPVCAADLFAAELFRDPAQPLVYLMLPGLDHAFTDKTGTDYGGETLSFYLDWVCRGEYPRAVFNGFSTKPGEH